VIRVRAFLGVIWARIRACLKHAKLTKEEDRLQLMFLCRANLFLHGHRKVRAFPALLLQPIKCKNNLTCH